MGNPKLGIDLAGPDLPTTYQGDTALLEDRANVRAAMIRRLDTPLGGLFSHPEYGNPVHDILSEPMDAAWVGKAESGLRQCLAQEPRIVVESITSDIYPEERKAVFSISYAVVDEPGSENLVWEVDLS